MLGYGYWRRRQQDPLQNGTGLPIFRKHLLSQYSRQKVGTLSTDCRQYSAQSQPWELHISLVINYGQKWEITDNIWCIQWGTNCPLTDNSLHTFDPPLLLPTYNVQILRALWNEWKRQHRQNGDNSKQTQQIVPHVFVTCSSHYEHILKSQNTMLSPNVYEWQLDSPLSAGIHISCICCNSRNSPPETSH